MSEFYNLLKEKANDPKYKDEVAIIGGMHFNEDVNYFSITYNELLKKVDEYIEMLKDPEHRIQPVSGHRTYIVVDNSIQSIAAIIAILESGSTPVIIDGKNVPEIDKQKLPYICYSNLISHEKNEDEVVSHAIWYNGILRQKLEGEDNVGPKMIIFSSGTEEKAHPELIEEEKILNQSIEYGEKNSIFYSYISCANISGLLTNLVNFLVHDNKLLLTQDFNFGDIYFINNYQDLKETNFLQRYRRNSYFLSTANPSLMELVLFRKNSILEAQVSGDRLSVLEESPDYKPISWDMKTALSYINGQMMRPDSIMLPRNVLDYLKSENISNVDLSSLKHIYLSGGINSIDVVNTLRKKIPSIKPGVFTNLYGSTEANGVICYCDEENFKTCYINVCNSDNRKISYTFDMKKFYEVANGVVTEIPAPEDTFGYMPYLTASNGRVPEITINNLMNISYKEVDTGDLGLYIDDQLYILGRKSELIRANGKTYIGNSLESYFSKKIDGQVLVITDGADGIQPFIKFDRIKDGELVLKKYEDLVALGKNISAFHLNYPVVIDDFILKKSSISGKQPRSFLHHYADFAETQHQAIVSNFTTIPDISHEIMQVTNYDYVMLKDGSFVVKLFCEPIMISNDVIEGFYEVHAIADDLVRFYPKLPIIFANNMHTLFSLAEADEKKLRDKIRKRVFEVLMENIEIYIVNKNMPLTNDMSKDELLQALENNIALDYFRRATNQVDYKRMIKAATAEELSKFDEGMKLPVELEHQTFKRQ